MIVTIVPDATQLRAPAMRMAGHLRALAAMLRERGANAPPVPLQRHLHSPSRTFSGEFSRALNINWLRWILAHRPLDADPAATRLIRQVLRFYPLADRSDVTEEDQQNLSMETVEAYLCQQLGECKRYYHYMSRWLTDDVDLVVALQALRSLNSLVALRTWGAAYWVARRPDHRFLAGIEQAARIEEFAALIDMTAGTTPGAARWGLPPRGYWRSVAYNLVMQFNTSCDYFVQRGCELGCEVSIDFIREQISPALLMEYRTWNVVRRCRESLVWAAQARQTTLRLARLRMCRGQSGFSSHDYVLLETWERGVRVEGYLRAIDFLACEWFDPA